MRKNLFALMTFLVIASLVMSACQTAAAACPTAFSRICPVVTLPNTHSPWRARMVTKYAPACA